MLRAGKDNLDIESRHVWRSHNTIWKTSYSTRHYFLIYLTHLVDFNEPRDFLHMVTEVCLDPNSGNLGHFESGESTGSDCGTW